MGEAGAAGVCVPCDLCAESLRGSGDISRSGNAGGRENTELKNKLLLKKRKLGWKGGGIVKGNSCRTKSDRMVEHTNTVTKNTRGIVKYTFAPMQETILFMKIPHSTKHTNIVAKNT